MKFDGILGLGRMKEAVVADASFIHNLKSDVNIILYSVIYLHIPK